MKKLFTLFIILVVMATMFSGCKKESDQKENQFIVDSEAYTVDKMGLYFNGELTNGYIYYVDFSSPGIGIDEDGYFTDSGSFIELVFTTTSSDGIATGDYPFSNLGDGSAPSMSINANSCYCLSWTYGTMNTYTYIVSGNAKVTRNESGYVVSFTGTDSDGKAVSLYYEGTGDIYDFSKKKSAAHSGINQSN